MAMNYHETFMEQAQLSFPLSLSLSLSLSHTHSGCLVLSLSLRDYFRNNLFHLVSINYNEVAASWRRQKSQLTVVGILKLSSVTGFHGNYYSVKVLQK